MTRVVKTKEQLIRSAIEFFARKGFRGSSVRDIANATNTSYSNIYHYFGNKEGLILAVLQYASQSILERLNEISHYIKDPVERFEALLTAHIEFGLQFGHEAKLFFLDEEHLSPEGCQINDQLQRKFLTIYRNELKILKEAGLVQTKSVTVMAFNVLAVINWVLRWYKEDGPLSREEVVEEIRRFALHGIFGLRDQASRSE